MVITGLRSNYLYSLTFKNRRTPSSDWYPGSHPVGLSRLFNSPRWIILPRVKYVNNRDECEHDEGIVYVSISNENINQNQSQNVVQMKLNPPNFRVHIEADIRINLR